MDFNTYQKLADLTAIYPDKGTFDGLYYTTAAIAAEAGEINGKWAKYVRGDVNPNLRGDLIKEAGDTLWFLAAIATDLDTTLEEIADQNLRKLQSRQERGVLKGSGDNR